MNTLFISFVPFNFTHLINLITLYFSEEIGVPSLSLQGMVQPAEHPIDEKKLVKELEVISINPKMFMKEF